MVNALNWRILGWLSPPQSGPDELRKLFWIVSPIRLRHTEMSLKPNQ
jgi:hypothetical protein